jgi:type II secretory pathway component PulM
MDALAPLALTGRQYVAAAYLVFLVVVLLYLVIISGKISRIEREVTTLAELADKRAP